MTNGISRRGLLKLAAAAAGGLGLYKIADSLTTGGKAQVTPVSGQELSSSVPLEPTQTASSTATQVPDPVQVPANPTHQTFLPDVPNAESQPPTATATNTPTPTSTHTPTPTSTSTHTPTPTSTSTHTPTPTETSSVPPVSRVVHVHDADATSWNFGNTYYGDYVDQATVSAMVNRGVMDLTGAPSVAQAWQTLIPGYAPGAAIAVKVNFNNCMWCKSTELAIDALPQPVNSIVEGLSQAYANFNPADVWVYDATIGFDPPWSGRAIPNRFQDLCLYNVRFFDQSAEQCSEVAGYASSDPTAIVTWRNPAGIPTPPEVQVTDVLVNASYLIDIPIIKRHVGKGVTLSFKNHFGSIANPRLLHDWTTIDDVYYGGTEYNPLVDLYRNDHVGPKTVLVIGDALFGNWVNNLEKPTPWSTFGNDAPNSLLFSTDPVAIDCVMCDLLHAENSLRPGSDDYLVYAAACGLGTYERGNPWGSGYSQIEYLKVEL